MFVVPKPVADGHGFELTQDAGADGGAPGGGKMEGRPIDTIGYRGMHSYEIAFDNWFVPAGNLIGQADGEGSRAGREHGSSGSVEGDGGIIPPCRPGRTPRAGGRCAAPGILRAGRGQEPGQRWADGLPQQLVHGGGQRKFAELGQPLEQLRHKGVEPMSADPATGLPQDLGGRRHLRAVRARPSPGPGVGRGRGARRSSRMAALR